MAVDNKYGKVTTERGTIGEDEPVIVFRAQDALLTQLLDHYKELCEHNGSPEHHIGLIEETTGQIVEWQTDNADRVKVPTSSAFDPEAWPGRRPSRPWIS